MTKKGLLGAKPDGEDTRRNPQESSPSLNKQTLQTRIPSAKKLPPVEETTTQNAVVGKFSETESADDDVAMPLASSSASSSAKLPPMVPPPSRRGQLTRAESNGSLRRGTPRPQELTKTLSRFKLVLEESGLDKVEEEDLDMV